MKRLLWITPIFTVTLLAVAVFAVNLGLFHSQMENWLAQKTGSRVQLGSVYIIPKWPLTLSIGSLTLENAGFHFTWKDSSIEIASLTPPYAVTLNLIEPKFNLVGEYSVAPKPDSPAAAAKSGPAAAAPIRLSVNIQDGEFKSRSLEVTKLDLNFEQKVLLISAAKIHAKAMVQAEALPVQIPMSVDCDALILTMETLKAADLKLFFGGLLATASGTSLWQEGRHRWKAVVAAPDLGKLPQPPMDIPANNWKGSIQLNAEIVKDGTDKPWAVEGDVHAEKVSANVKFQSGQLLLQGPFAMELESHFIYADNAPVIPSLKASVDLTSTHVVVQNILQKSPGTAFRANLKAEGTLDSLKIEAFALEFWKFTGKVVGQAKLKAPYAVNLNFDAPEFSLEGADKILLPLAASPVKGQLGARGNFTGNLLEAAKGHLRLDLFKLKDFAADVDYDKPGVFKAKGPVKLSLEGKINVSQAAVAQADLKGRADLTDAALVAGPLRKESKQILRADFQARNVADVLEVQNLSVESFAGRLRISGKVKTPLDPSVQLAVDLQPLDLSELRVALPDWREKIPKGTVSGRILLNGRQDKLKPWNDWPLDIDGQLKLNIPEYNFPPSAAPATAKAELKPGGLKQAPADAGFLPPGHLTGRMKMKITADVGKIKKDQLSLTGLHSEGAVGSGHFKGSVAIKEIFSGSVQVTALDVPLIELRPAIQGKANWNGIVIEDAMSFAKPQFKDFATGRMAGTADFMTFLPSDEQFLSFLKAKGEASLEPVTLNSVKVGQMINDLVKQLPMIKMQPVKTDPLKGTVKVVFDLRNQVVQVDPLLAHDVDNSELQLKGKVTVPGLQGDLAGAFLWSNAQIKGCLFEGNSDANGRMIIPVAIKGDLMHPGLSSLSDMVAKLGGRALECERGKLIENIKKDGGKKLQEDLQKSLQGLFGH